MKLWKTPKISGNLSIAQRNPLLAKLLLARNIDTDTKVEEFLNPEIIPFIPFSVFKKAEDVIKRIQSAVEIGEKIIVYGDFDTDGVTSTAILYKTLLKIGANAGYYLPDRDAESHGLNNKAIINLISKHKAKLIITVDCGVSDTAEVKLAKTFKTDIIITDHHEAPAQLPEAFAVINPKAADVLQENTSAKDIESLCSLSGAGIAFKLASALLERFEQKDFIQELVPIAALGTIGDIVPLILENRRIAFSGIKSIKNKTNKGITKLFENAGIKDFDKITSETVSFTAVPRINATGRLGSADIAFKLLISDDDNEIDEITKNLNDINSLRQTLCEEAFERAVSIVDSSPELYEHSIVICDNESNIGIIGLSASRLVEKYNVPAFVMRKDDNKYRCSCRGLKGVNIFEILNANKDLFLGFGGHEFAGGFSFDASQHSFEEVKKAIDNIVFEQTNGKKLENILNVDVFLSPDDVTSDLVDTVKMLEPFGAANPSPVFAMERLKISDFRFMGQNQNHLKLFCTTDDGRLFECVKWSVSTLNAGKGSVINIAFAPEINTFNGKTTIQLLLKDMQFPDVNLECPVKLIDCRNQKGGYDKIADFLEHTKKKVGIFTENQDVIKYFSQYKTAKEKVFQRDNIPENIDMCICVDSPPSSGFLKKLVLNKVKEILFMNYDDVQDDSRKVLAKIAGMMRYALSSLDGKTSLKAMRPALFFDDNVTLKALAVLKNAGIINADIDADGNISVFAVRSANISKLNDIDEFFEFNSLYDDYKRFSAVIKNSPSEEIRHLILK